MIDQQCPIGVFDSGVGGISTLRTLAAMLPNEDFVFYGDSANAPYGEKSAEQVYELTQRAVEKLRERSVKAIVIACNTATSAAKPELMKNYPDITFLGIEPAVKLAVDSGKKNVLVMATPLTLSLQKFHRQLERFHNSATIYPLPCPGLAELIEKGPAALPDIREYLKHLFERVRNESLDSVVLGCTHYPFIADTIQAELKRPVELFTGFEGLGRNLERQLAARHLLRHLPQEALAQEMPFNTAPSPVSVSALQHEQTVSFMSSKNTHEELALYEELFDRGFAA